MDKEELLITYLKKYKKEVESGLLIPIGEGSMGLLIDTKTKYLK